ncbi:MAG: hypothetical protein ACOYKQ_12055 [Polymorphobacter sp.]
MSRARNISGVTHLGRTIAAMETEVRYLLSVPVGDGGIPDHLIRAAAMRAGVAESMMREKLRGRVGR